jgi:hypothetical protein
MSNKTEELSESGHPIYRYKPVPPPELAPSLLNPAQRDIDEHIKTNFGEVSRIFHEILPVKIHVDLNLIEPNESRNYYALVTSGLSTLPMSTPPDYSQCKYSELYMCLPREWSMNEKTLEDEVNYWPFRCLKFLARFPHEYKTWIWNMHTIPNENPIKPFAKNTKLCCSLLSTPKRLPEKAYRLRINKDKTIFFHSVIPIYREEMEYKLKHGAEALLGRFDKDHVDELLDVSRMSVVKKGLFGLS